MGWYISTCLKGKPLIEGLKSKSTMLVVVMKDGAIVQEVRFAD